MTVEGGPSTVRGDSSVRQNPSKDCGVFQSGARGWVEKSEWGAERTTYGDAQTPQKQCSFMLFASLYLFG